MKKICDTPIFDRKVSIVRCVTDPTIIDTIPLKDFLALADLPKNRGYIDRARTFAGQRKTKDDEATQAYNRIKKYKLPCACLSGVFHDRRAESQIIGHTGLICIDIDAGDKNPHITDWAKAKADICQYSCIAYCALSASGDGLFCVVPIDKPLQVTIPPVSASYTDRKKAIERVKDLHLRQFQALQISFKDIGYNIDSACSNLDRLRVLSYDDEAYINRDAENYTHIVPKPKQVMKPTTQKRVYLSTPPQGQENITLEQWLNKYGVEYSPNGDKFNVTCPWEALHSSHTGDKQTCVFEKNGKWCFHCFHDHCTDKTFKDYSQAIKCNSDFKDIKI